jgi:hypothetical protein
MKFVIGPDQVYSSFLRSSHIKYFEREKKLIFAESKKAFRVNDLGFVTIRRIVCVF